MTKLASIGDAAAFLGVSRQTLRRWEREGRLEPAERTRGGQRRYDLTKLRLGVRAVGEADYVTIGYARVSGPEYQDELDRQRTTLVDYCARRGWAHEIITDMGSGMNYHKHGLRRLLERILSGKVQRLVLTNKDRLLRFGGEIIFELCALRGVELVVLNTPSDDALEEELRDDVLETIALLSAKLTVAQGERNQRMLDRLKDVAEAATT